MITALYKTDFGKNNYVIPKKATIDCNSQADMEAVFEEFWSSRLLTLKILLKKTPMFSKQLFTQVFQANVMFFRILSGKYQSLRKLENVLSTVITRVTGCRLLDLQIYREGIGQKYHPGNFKNLLGKLIFHCSLDKRL